MIEGTVIAPEEHRWEGTAGYKHQAGFITNHHVVPNKGMRVIKIEAAGNAVVGVCEWTKKTVAVSFWWILLSRIFPFITIPTNKVDASYVRTNEPVSVFKDTGVSIVNPVKGQPTYSRGRVGPNGQTEETTGEVLTESEVISVEIQPGRYAIFEDVFKVSNHTIAGKSGSPIRTAAGILGVIFAGPIGGGPGYCIKASNIVQAIA